MDFRGNYRLGQRTRLELLTETLESGNCKTPSGSPGSEKSEFHERSWAKRKKPWTRHGYTEVRDKFLFPRSKCSDRTCVWFGLDETDRKRECRRRRHAFVVYIRSSMHLSSIIAQQSALELTRVHSIWPRRSSYAFYAGWDRKRKT